MKRESRSRSWIGLAASALALALLVAPAGAQGPGKATATPAASKAGVKTVKKRRKPRGRLPAYYSRVVTAKQRDEIYSIQARYNEQIQKLQQQLETLVAQRNADVEKVLSAEQRAEVEQLRARRKAKRAAGKTAKNSDAKPSGNG